MWMSIFHISSIFNSIKLSNFSYPIFLYFFYYAHREWLTGIFNVHCSVKTSIFFRILFRINCTFFSCLFIRYIFLNLLKLVINKYNITMKKYVLPARMRIVFLSLLFLFRSLSTLLILQKTFRYAIL